jgi:Flp pilus assembly protein TadG
MSRALTRRLRRFHGSEDATATLEFAIVFPFFISLFLSSVELGLITFQHSMLERGLDMAVRDVRLGTGTNPTAEDIKDGVCYYAGVLPDCDTNLRLEMVTVDPRNFTPPPARADCTDQSEDPRPLRNFVHGGANQMMMLRACYVFSPIFPTAGLGAQLVTDGAGNAAMTATSAFVQEPRG